MSRLKVSYLYSGFAGGIRLPTLSDNCSPELKKQLYSFMADWFEEMTSKYIISSHVMYNLLSDSEKGVEYLCRDLSPLAPSLKIYSDSGGLQMARGTGGTKNHKDIEGLKEKIYGMMAKYTDYGLCFDKIPIKELNSTEQSEYQNVTIVNSMVKPCGIETGKDVKKQIEHFKKTNSKAKVITILQGITEDQRNRFAEGLYSQLSEEDYEFIAGTAIGGLHSLSLDKIYELYYNKIENIPVPDIHKENVHFLGIASMIKVLPLIVISKHRDNFYHNLKHISTDSTTFTCSEQYGKFQDIEKHYKTYTLGKSINKQVLEMQNRRFEYFRDRFKKFLNIDIDFKEYLNKFTVYRNDYRHSQESFDKMDDYALYTFRFFLSFADETNKFIHGLHNYERFLTHKEYGPIIELVQKIHTKSDYDTYKRYLDDVIRNNATRSITTIKEIEDNDTVIDSSLNELF